MTNRPGGKVAYDNTGRVVLVTGGAQGIGRAICQAFAETGAHVVCADIIDPGSDMPAAVRFKQTDTASEADCQAAVDWTVSTFGGLDVLVNNAAIQPPTSYVPVHALDSELAQRMVGINLMGYTYMAKHALRVMRDQSSGVVINIASGQGDRTARGCPFTVPSKPRIFCKRCSGRLNTRAKVFASSHCRRAPSKRRSSKPAWLRKAVPKRSPIATHLAALASPQRSPPPPYGLPAKMHRSSPVPTWPLTAASAPSAHSQIRIEAAVAVRE